MENQESLPSYEKACMSLKHIIDVEFPLQTEINDAFLNTSLSPYISIGNISDTSDTKNALLVVFKQAIKNTQEQKRSLKIDTSIFAEIDENKHKFITKDQSIGKQEVTKIIPKDSYINEFSGEKGSIEKSLPYAGEIEKYQISENKIKNSTSQNSIQTTEKVNKQLIKKNSKREKLDNMLKDTQSEVIQILDTTIVTKINNLLEELENTNETYKQNTIGQEIYVMIQDIYPTKSILLQKFREDYIFKAGKVNGILLKLALSPQRSNTAIKNIVSDLKRKTDYK